MTRDCLDPLVISRLRASFSSILSTEQGRTRLATTFYSTLFAEQPEFRSLFPAALDQQKHRLFQALEFVIDNLEDQDRVLGFLAQLGRDHRKYGVEGRHYSASARALLVAVQDSFTRAIWTPSLTTAWSELIELLLHTMADAADNDDLPAAWGATVVGHERLLDDLAVVRLEADSPIPYAAGQYLSVQIPQRPRLWRYLSAAIPTNPYGQIEFHVRRVSGGWVSPAIVNETQVGDRWLLSSPLGGLEVDRADGRDVLMIGSGTGIAPLRAQVMDMAMKAENPRVHLFVGGKYPATSTTSRRSGSCRSATRGSPWCPSPRKTRTRGGMPYPSQTSHRACIDDFRGGSVRWSPGSGRGPTGRSRSPVRPQ